MSSKAPKPVTGVPVINQGRPSGNNTSQTPAGRAIESGNQSSNQSGRSNT